ncbi:MAG TPA: sulfotransferase [Saprospiraceae bacterium]|nr:sulfotransferase [Saprospiraceae bacterium]HMQ83904.1 sulfotransferase [Saprospiraceae bacterium]
MNPKHKPFIFLIGVRKAGTTSLFEMLARHPQIGTNLFSKEPQILCLPQEHLDRQFDLLERDYPSDTSHVLDGSTFYLYSKNALNAIKTGFPNSKILIILRDPAKRAYSAYWHLKKKSQGVEKRTFEACIDPLLPSNAKGIHFQERQALQAAKEKGLIAPDKMDYTALEQKYGVDWRQIFTDPFFQYHYIGESCYHHYLQSWHDHFDESQLKIVLLEELQKDTSRVLFEVFNFLGLAPYDQVEASAANPTMAAQSSLSRLAIRIYQTGVVRQLLRIFGSHKSRIIGRLKSGLYSKAPEMSLDVYTKTRTLLQAEYDYWQQHLPQTKELWKQ